MAAQNSPVYGAVRDIAVNPNDPTGNTVLIGSVNGGIWRTTNATAANPTWTPLTDSLPTLSVGAVTYDKANTNNVYMGVGRYSADASLGGDRNGIWVSTNSGTTWAQTAGSNVFATPSSNVSGLAVSGSIILATVDSSVSNNFADKGVFISTNGGTTFTHNGTGLSSVAASAIVADPKTAGRYYIGVQAAASTSSLGVWRTDDSGATWTRISSPAIDALLSSSTDNIKLAINNNGTLFVGIDNNTGVPFSGRLAGVFRTTDQGATFTNFGIPTTTEGTSKTVIGIHPGAQGFLHFAMAADPTNDNVVIVAGDRQPLGDGVDYTGPFSPNSIGATDFTGRIFRSTAAGSWTPETHVDTASNSAPHADSRALVFAPNGSLLTGNDGGLYQRTTPETRGSGDWTSISGVGATGLRVTEFHSVAYDNHGGILMGGAQDNGSSQQSAPGSFTWASIGGGDGGVVGVYDRPGGDSFRYNCNQFLFNFVRREYNAAGAPVGGAVFSNLTVSGSSGSKAIQDLDATVDFYNPYAVNVVDPGRLVFGTKSLYESANHGATLTCLGGLNGGGTAPKVVFSSLVAAMAYGGFVGATGFSDVLYSGAGTELRIRPAGGGFNNLPGVDAAYNTAAGNSGFSIVDLVLDYQDWHTAFVGDSLRRVFWTTDAGATWSLIPGLDAVIGTDMTTLEFVASGSIEAIFAGGRNGVFWSLNTGSGFGSWARFGTGLSGAKVMDLNYDRYADVLAGATLGRGAWTVGDVTSDVNGPEPCTFVLFALGALGALRSGRRRRAVRNP